jgi:hypothetical protein
MVPDACRRHVVPFGLCREGKFLRSVKTVWSTKRARSTGKIGAQFKRESRKERDR